MNRLTKIKVKNAAMFHCFTTLQLVLDNIVVVKKGKKTSLLYSAPWDLEKIRAEMALKDGPPHNAVAFMDCIVCRLGQIASEGAGGEEEEEEEGEE